MANNVGYIVISGHLKVGGKWYPKGEVIRGLANPIARELIKAGRIKVLEEPKDPVDPPKELDAPKASVNPPGDPEPPKDHVPGNLEPPKPPKK